MSGVEDEEWVDQFQRVDAVQGGRSILSEKNWFEDRDAKKQRIKNRKSLGRRVSFAPDAHLETTHLYPKEVLQEGHGGSLISRELIERINKLPSWQVDHASPAQAAALQPSPGGSSMDLTNSTSNLPVVTGQNLPDAPERDAQDTLEFRPSPGAMGEVTRGVPSLADLIQSDGETDQFGKASGGSVLGALAEQNITEGVPSLGSLLEEVDTGQLGHSAVGDGLSPDQYDRPSSQQDRISVDAVLQDSAAQTELDDSGKISEESGQLATNTSEDNGSMQINKWGFAPGEDDTQDLNMENKGRAFMGDTTYHHIYGSNENTADTARQQQLGGVSQQLAPAALEHLFRRADKATDMLRSAIKTKLDSPGSAQRRARGSQSGSKLKARSPWDSELGTDPKQSRRWLTDDLQESAEPKRRLSDAFSDGGDIAEKAEVGRLPADSPWMLTPEAVTPASMPGPAGNRSLAPSAIPSIARSVPRDLLTGSPGPNQRNLTPSQHTPWTNPVSAERPLIDMATPVSERGAQVKQLTDAFDSVPVAKKSRLSVATTNNDTASLLGGDDDGTDSLLNADEDDGLGEVIPGSALKAHTSQTGMDLTARLLLDDSVDIRPSPFQQAEQRLGGANALRAFAVASGFATVSPSPQALVPSSTLKGDRAVMTTKLIAESTDGTRFASPQSAILPRPGSNLASLPTPASHGAPGAVDSPGPASAQQPRPAGETGQQEGTPQGLATPQEHNPSSEEEKRQALARQPVAPTPVPNMFPGGALLQRTPVNAKQKSFQQYPAQLQEATPQSVQADISQPENLPPSSTRQDQPELTPSAKPASTPASAGRRRSARFAKDAPSQATPVSAKATAPKSDSTSKVMTRSAAKAASTPEGVASQRGKHRLARTPIRPLAPSRPFTFQDFLREVDIQFLDHMRRGASINLADLASDPPPHTLQDCYKVMCITGPEISQYDDGIQTLQRETAARKATAKEKEDLLAEQHLPLFKQIQAAGTEDHEAIKCGAQALKKLCRIKTNMSWKEWRATMESQKGVSLQGKLHLLQHDRGFLQSNLKYLTQLGDEISNFAGKARSAAAARLEAHAAEVSRRRKIVAMRASLAEARAQHASRAEKKSALDQHMSELKARRAFLGSERGQLQVRLAQLQEEVEASQQAMAALQSRKLTGEALLSKIFQTDILSGCMDIRLEANSSSAQHSHVCLVYGSLFRLCIFFKSPEADISAPAVQGYLEMVPPDECSLTQDQRAFAAQLAQNPALSHSSILDEFSLPQGTASAMQATVRHFSAKLGRIKDLLLEIDALPLDFPKVSEVAVLPGAALRLGFLDLETETKFAVLLSNGLCQRNGFSDAKASVFFPGPNGLTAAAICTMVMSLGPGFRQVRAVCALLSALASGELEPATPQAEQERAVFEMEPAGGSMHDGQDTLLHGNGTGVTDEATGPVVEATKGQNATAAAPADASEEQTNPLHVFSNPLFSARQSMQN